MLEQAAMFHEREITQWIERFARLVEPLLMLVMGLGIGTIVVLLYLPVFDRRGTCNEPRAKASDANDANDANARDTGRRPARPARSLARTEGEPLLCALEKVGGLPADDMLALVAGESRMAVLWLAQMEAMTPDFSGFSYAECLQQN